MCWVNNWLQAKKKIIFHSIIYLLIFAIRLMIKKKSITKQSLLLREHYNNNTPEIDRDTEHNN